jgi:hypothetical protein
VWLTGPYRAREFFCRTHVQRRTMRTSKAQAQGVKQISERIILYLYMSFRPDVFRPRSLEDEAAQIFKNYDDMLDVDGWFELSPQRLISSFAALQRELEGAGLTDPYVGSGERTRPIGQILSQLEAVKAQAAAIEVLVDAEVEAGRSDEQITEVLRDTVIAQVSAVQLKPNGRTLRGALRQHFIGKSRSKNIKL